MKHSTAAAEQPVGIGGWIPCFVGNPGADKRVLQSDKKTSHVLVVSIAVCEYLGMEES